MVSKYISQWFFGLKILALGYFWIFACGVNSQEPITMETIAKAWKARQDKVKSARFEWEEKELILKGSVSKIWNILKGNKFFSEIIPPNDTFLKNNCEVEFDGKKLRVVKNTQVWSKKTNKFEPTTQIKVFDGNTFKMLILPSENYHFYWPQGSIRQQPYHIDEGITRLKPILMNYKPLETNDQKTKPIGFNLTGNLLNINNEMCLELVGIYPVNDIYDKLWICPKYNFSAVKYIRLFENIVIEKVNVKFKYVPLFDWIPDEWEIVTNNSKGVLIDSNISKVSKFQINHSVDKSSFNLDFPLGTRVEDEKAKISYVIKPDGTGNRMINSSNVGLTYEQLSQTKPRNGKDTIISFFYIFGLVLISGIVAYLLQKKISKKGVKP